MPKRILIPVFLFVIIAMIFGAGFLLGKTQIPAAPPAGILNADLGEPQGVDFSLFWSAWNILEEKFVDPTRLDYQKMIYGAISGMVSSLNDPYTVYMPPEEAKIFKEDVSGEFQGVGMEIGIREGILTVIAPLEGTPAQRAGLRSGDKILGINGTSTASMTSDEAVKIIRGPKGTNVTLTVMRDGWTETKDFTITRDVIVVPSLKWEIKDNDIAYIRLYEFSETATRAFNQAAVEILNSHAKKIILDLRDNPGGYLEVAQDISGWLLQKGQVVTIEDFGDEIEDKSYLAEGSAQLAQYPTIVLINQGSASGSEILAGAMRDNRQVKLIGEKSFGKGSVQTLEEMRQGSLKVTVARWLTPNGTLIDGKGLEPDVKVELTEADFEQGKDPQLDRAIEIVNSLR